MELNTDKTNGRGIYFGHKALQIVPIKMNGNEIELVSFFKLLDIMINDKAYGISESACKFISSYLSSRQQRVKVEGDKGEWQYLKRGVPQGSVFGPLHFNIFQNDLFYFLVSLCILYNYANDNTMSKSDKDVKVLEYKLSIASQKAIKWFKDNFMKANDPKFQGFIFSRDKEIEGITINLEGVQLHHNECSKFYGCTCA